MHVLAINGSPHKNGNTATALQMMAEELDREGISCDIVQVGHELLHGCTGCGHCRKPDNPDKLCVFTNDILNSVLPRFRAADGIILGSPTYYGGIAGAMKCFLDRAFYTSAGFQRNKVGAAVAVVRRAGGVDVYNQLNNYLNLAEMITPPSQYWVVGYGRSAGEINQDGEGVQTIRKNANAMAWLLKMRQAAQGSIPLPRVEDKVATHFIR